MSIHDINPASHFSDYPLGMKDGELITEGTLEKAITEGYIKEIFEIGATIVTLSETNEPVSPTYDPLSEGQKNQL